MLKKGKNKHDIVYHTGSQSFSDYVPLQHFDWWACTPEISDGKNAE